MATAEGLMNMMGGKGGGSLGVCMPIEPGVEGGLLGEVRFAV